MYSFSKAGGCGAITHLHPVILHWSSVSKRNSPNETFITWITFIDDLLKNNERMMGRLVVMLKVQQNIYY